MSASQEPTATVGLREDFRTELTVRFRALKGAINKTAGYENDTLGLKQGDSNQLFAAADDITPARSFQFTTDQEAQDAFMDWLDTQIDRGILESTGRTAVRNGEHYTARYVRSGYSRGVDHADAQLNEHGVEVPEQDIQQAFNRPIAQQDLEQLYTRTFDELEDITQDMQTNIRRELSTGFSEGWNPRKTAAAINDRVDKVGITRAERLARTETLNAHNTASRSRYGEFGVKKVDILGHNPCTKICAPIIAGNPYPLDDIPRGGAPFHPNCLGTETPATDSSGTILMASAGDVARTAA